MSVDTGKPTIRNKFDVLRDAIGNELDHTMKPKSTPRPKLTDAERHARFVDMAREVGVDERLEAFDRAFEKVTAKRPQPKND